MNVFVKNITKEEVINELKDTNQEKKLYANNIKGITLIALVITIIVILILAGVSINTLFGDNGLLTKAQDAANANKKAGAYDKIVAEVYASYGNDGKLDLEQLNKNFINHLPTLKHGEKGKEKQTITEENKIKLLPAYVELDGYEFEIAEDGTVTPTDTALGGGNGEVALKPDSTEIPEEPKTFSTEYGTIDVIWLSNTGETVTDTPNAPILYASDNPNEKLTPVKFNEGTSNWDNYETNDNNWYNYQAGNTTNRTVEGKLVDNQLSKWANAKTANGSYFVWIPRYAYRITYYSSDTSTEPTGYYDGYGMWNAETKTVNYELDKGIETVISNGKTYIVHPAFTDSLDNGGWSSPLPGFWFAKFEMSEDSLGNLQSVNGVASIREQTIGEFYTNARGAKFGYTGKQDDTDKNTSFMSSHMVKNSEWGAVAYLTHSQYGRNGNAIKQNSTYWKNCTGGGTGNSYITNKLQSTTGNVYGVYDMSGGQRNMLQHLEAIRII